MEVIELKNHSEGFENAEMIHDLLDRFATAKELREYVGEEYYRDAFKIVPCRRKLRYVGLEGDFREHDYFKKGEVYYSIDFTGATYSIEGYKNREKRIGCCYFEWIED